MPAKRETAPAADAHASAEHRIEGHSVEIRRHEDREELWIDGTRRKFFVTRDGYTLNDDAYARPQKALIDAVKNFLRRNPQLGSGHEH